MQWKLQQLAEEDGADADGPPVPLPGGPGGPEGPGGAGGPPGPPALVA